MITAWTQHLKTQQEKDAFEKQILGAYDVLNRLSDICKERIKAIEVQEKDFSPGWDYKMANLIGRRSELMEIQKLLDHRSNNEHPRPGRK